MRNVYRILLIDGHPVFREGLRRIIESRSHLSVVAEAGSAAEGLSKARLCSPDLIITDLPLGDDGQDFIRTISQESPELPIFVVSETISSGDVVRAIEGGARGYITKAASRHELLNALQEVIQGRSYLHPEVAHILFSKVRKPQVTARRSPCLTSREKETLNALCHGMSPKDVSQSLYLSVSTVKTHMRNLYRKLDVNSRTQLVLRAIEMDIATTKFSRRNHA